ncbi:NADH-ubiquinone oxidoreductase-F iron-sulfur binding region domain-containing protein [Geodermatophilus ruber]|uniref:NADH:ubiquinone oxidoreductase, NADH-binding subunit (Chain F) n=1 Tax=Geodermatophilus ruber TaxID=504800 RepID=A0A1I4E0H0_9ACTN|nr:NADH-ubiquinone oxidoreductase-F iron-sulfur binding region domain-containing protein [Geodermatophilus ruber]SFK98047.1 NADH:ubiquinone oxidoreductase, NADH-binding subunit (chain F) [Geodermatophilus ruber]
MTAASATVALLSAPGPTLADHLATHGPLPPGDAIAVAEEAGLTGRGGGGFPTAVKLRSVAGGRRAPVVVANGSEGEPASAKDAVLLSRAPHLVLDGIALVAGTLGAASAVLAADAARLPELAPHVAERRDRLPVRLHPVAAGYLAGEESALVAALNGRAPVPTSKFPPVRERGVDGRPTLVINVETLARLALLARGDSSAGDRALLTRRLERAGRLWVDVVDAPLSTPLAEWLPLDADVQAVLIGGYAGTWVPARTAARLSLDHSGLAAAGARLGAGVLAALPADRCGLRETARVVHFLAGESAGQCGPCLNGLPRIAAAMDLLARPAPPPPDLLPAVRRWCGLLPGRGACSHPDGTVRLVAGALGVFGPELDRHRAGTCTARVHRAFLPVPRRPR